MARQRGFRGPPPHLHLLVSPGLPPLLLLMLLLLLPPPLLRGVTGSGLSCHKTCICASNIVSCSKMNLSAVPAGLPQYTAVLDLSYNGIAQLRADWTAVKLLKLHSLLLSHNGLTFLSTRAFSRVTRLRYLDLSSNALRQLDEFIFEPLAQLEVLLLYNNRISQINLSAFAGLGSLQKLYLSQNQVSRFPLELVKERTRLEKLSLLDVSSNRLKSLPVEELEVLPALIKNGLYFHNNPLACDCALYGLLAHWSVRHFSSATDFKDEHTCALPGQQQQQQKTTVGILRLNGDYMNCSTFEEAHEEAYLDQTLVLGCDTRHRDMVKTWVMPSNAAVAAPPGANRSVALLPDGSLRVGPLRPEHSGVYTCFAVGETVNETLYVLLKVNNFTLEGAGEALNTGYTTLVGCLASIVLVLVYLYLTPCRCFCCPGRGCAKAHREDSVHSSALGVTPTHEDPGGRSGISRHVAFIDPKELQGQNGKVDLGAEGIAKGEGRGGRRRKSDAESVSSVFSDTPIVV